MIRRTRLSWLLPLALLMQLWAMATCCLPSSVAAVFAPGGTLVICSGSGSKTIDIGGGEQDRGGHGDMCAGLCAAATLALFMVLAGLFFFVSRLFGGTAPRYLRPRAPPLPYFARGPPHFV